MQNKAAGQFSSLFRRENVSFIFCQCSNERKKIYRVGVVSKLKIVVQDLQDFLLIVTINLECQEYVNWCFRVWNNLTIYEVTFTSSRPRISTTSLRRVVFDW